MRLTKIGNRDFQGLLGRTKCPAPVQHLEVGELCLPDFTHSFGGFLERDHLEFGSLHQIEVFQDMIDIRYRDEVAHFIYKMPGQLSGRLLWVLQC